MQPCNAGTWRVDKYLPAKMYGFVCDEKGAQVFFHLGTFQSPFHQEPFPPPILGEVVDVAVYPDGPEGKAPRARQVTRTTPAVSVQGVVDTFDHRTGYGFVNGDDGAVYYLHLSEVQDGRLPLRGQRVKFLAGFRAGRPRACHVELFT